MLLQFDWWHWTWVFRSGIRYSKTRLISPSSACIGTFWRGDENEKIFPGLLPCACGCPSFPLRRSLWHHIPTQSRRKDDYFIFLLRPNSFDGASAWPAYTHSRIDAERGYCVAKVNTHGNCGADMDAWSGLSVAGWHSSALFTWKMLRPLKQFSEIGHKISATSTFHETWTLWMSYHVLASVAA